MTNNNEDDLQVFEGKDPSEEDSSNDDASSHSSSSSSKNVMRTSRSSSSSQGKKLIQTRIREMVTPHLPPPIVLAMHRIDPQLEPWLGPEACITLVGTLLVAWIVLTLVRMIFLSTMENRGRGGRRAIADDDNDHDQVLSLSSKKGTGTAGSSSSAADSQYDATVLLCGPRNSGKTCLFYQLGLGVSDLIPTVTSIKANVTVSNNKPLTNKKKNSDSDDKENIENMMMMPPRIRYIDWPGHAPLNDSILEKSVWNKASTTIKGDDNDAAPILRIVLVLDATQPVAAAAEILYELWSRCAAQQPQQQQSISIFCACHKKDLIKAKNSKRIKIQMRTELQRILAVQKPSWWANSADAASSTTALDLNDLPYCKLHFASTSSSNNSQPQQQPGMDELAIFCHTGRLPSTGS